MEQKELLYEGKAKQVFATENPDYVIIHYKDEMTAYNRIKRAIIAGKGALNNKITTIIFNHLHKAGIATHYINNLNDQDQLCRNVKIIPIEVIVRNIAAGTMAKRLGITEGLKLNNTVYELCYKNDDLGDPVINEDHAVALGLADYPTLEYMRAQTIKINNVLTELFARAGITLVDFKIEFGITPDGEILLADEISPDSCRFWDAETGEKLDKDRFRRDMGNVYEGYKQVCDRLSNL